ncbi:MAG: polyprenyl diphosphate synthase, partial [Chloroflexota bacterium]
MSNNQASEKIPSSIPTHIAIIMDGNGRWARSKGLPRLAGHRAGTENLREIIKACVEFGVKFLTIYAFSTENWSRSKMEVNALFRLFSKYLRLELDNIHKENIRVTIMGRREGL